MVAAYQLLVHVAVATLLLALAIYAPLLFKKGLPRVGRNWRCGYRRNPGGRGDLCPVDRVLALERLILFRRQVRDRPVPVPPMYRRPAELRRLRRCRASPG